ncbi:MAG: aminotransferase class IV [Chloroflexota bacterium]|nr:aminotransferase class IV [Chloroflexota bacterium]MBI5704186.1 aminotransferase class IV [Chloroflexota bacterium]
MIRTWQITARGTREIHLSNASSLDEVTRQLPEGYYTTFRTYDSCTRVIGLKAHFNRLPNADASLLRRSLRLLLEPYRPGEARVRLMETKQGRFYISIEPLKLPPPEVYERGVCVETVTLQRTNPREKSTAFIGASEEERRKLVQRGIFEALLVRNGRILEGMTSNFFYVLDGVLHTARRGILLGVTRTMVIRAARGAGVEVRYKPLKLDQLPAVKEAFITSSSRGVVPVIQIDEVTVGEGRVGALTKQLSAAYEAYVRKKAETI